MILRCQKAFLPNSPSSMFRISLKYHPFSEYFDMLKTAKIRAHEMNNEASASSFPASNVSTYLSTGSRDNTRAMLQTLRVVMLDFPIVLPRDAHSPTTESEHHFMGIHFRFFSFHPDEPFRPELEWLIIDRGIMEHVPADNKHEMGLSRGADLRTRCSLIRLNLLE